MSLNTDDLTWVLIEFVLTINNYIILLIDRHVLRVMQGQRDNTINTCLLIFLLLPAIYPICVWKVLFM